MTAGPGVPPEGLPLQPFVMDGQTLRFRTNVLVRHLLDHGGLDLNDLACVDAPDEDRQQFAQLIGYSLGGYSELSYVDDAAYERAEAAAALASDAGTPEGERVEGWTGKPCPCPNCGAIRNERDAHFCSSTRAASAPLAESGAAPDAELKRLILAYADAVHNHPYDSFVIAKAHKAIVAHVEKVTREARAAGERAATGEVVGNARIVGGKLGVDLIAERVPALLQGEIMQVDLVVRRDKEGVCE